MQPEPWPTKKITLAAAKLFPQHATTAMRKSTNPLSKNILVQGDTHVHTHTHTHTYPYYRREVTWFKLRSTTILIDLHVYGGSGTS